MSDLFDSVAGAVGGALEPVAPALDFLGLGAADPMGRTDDPGSLIEGIGRGFQDAVMAGPAGLAAGAASLAQPNLSTRDRLIFGGLLLAGGTMVGRQAVRNWRARPAPALGMALPESFDPLSRMRAAPGHFTPPSQDNLRLRSEFPGLRRRSLDFMLAEDSVGRAAAIARFEPRSGGPDGRLATIAARLDSYDQTYGPGESSFDWSFFERAHDLGKLKTRSGKRVNELYRKFTDGDELGEEDWFELASTVRSTADALEGFNPDLTLGLTGRLHSIEYVDGRPVPVLRYSLPEASDVFSDELHRAQMLKSLNPGVQYPRAVRIIEDLYRQGAEDMSARAQGRPSALAAPVELGENWYQKSHDDILALADNDPKLHDRLTAIVALTSAEQDWGTNIKKAKMVERLLAEPAVADTDFQIWLRSRSRGTGEVYEGTRAREHHRTFSRLHKRVTQSWKLSTDAGSLQKVLRLAKEEPQDLFATTDAQKQKNFYLNLLDPKNPAPVTVDRHAFDVYWGMDSGVQDRPIMDALGGGESSYDIIADAYRQAAQNLSEEFGPLLPHQVQSMAWEVWRINKDAAYGGARGGAYRKVGWNGGNPYRVKLDGEENPAFLAMVGAGNELPGSLTGRPGEVLPVMALRTESGDLTLFADQYDVTYAAAVDPRTDYWARSMHPGPLGRDGVPRWVATKPVPVRSLDAVDTAVLRNPSAVVETVPAGTYPGFDAGDTISFDWTPGQRLPAWAASAAEQRGGFARSRPARQTEPLGRADMVDGPTVQAALDTHAWAVFTKPDRTLVSQLRREGFDPVELSGGDEPAVMVWGIEPEAAATLAPDRTVLTHTGEVSTVKLAALDTEFIRSNPDGFTIDPRTGKAYEGGGAAVATADSPEGRFTPDELTDDALDEFVDTNSVKLSRPGAYIGGWFDKDANEFVLDVSEVDPTVEGALGKAAARNEKAVFSFETFEDVPNPKYNEAAGRAVAQPWVVPNRAGDVVEINPSREAGDLAPARVDERATRFHYKVDQRQAHLIADLADDLERAGGANVVLYSRQPNISGFERAREHVFKGPGGLKIVRTADTTIGGSNAVPVHVRNARVLPDKPLSIDPEQVGTDHILFEERGTKKIVNVEAEGDLAMRVDDAELLAQKFGYDNVELKFEGETIPLYRPAKVAFPHAVDKYTKTVGIDVPAKTRQPARDDPNIAGVRVVSRFGPGDQYELSPKTQGEIASALDIFTRAHPEVAEVWRLSWVSVDRQLHGKVQHGKTPSSYIAAVNPEPGSGIHLNEERWVDEFKLRGDLTLAHEQGYLAAKDVQGIILHELGHIMHNVVELLEVGTVGKKRKTLPPIAQKAIELFDTLKDDQANVMTSGRAKVDPQEMIAEAVSDVLTGQNRFSMSRPIYDMVVESLREALPNRQKFWGKVAS
jgi:hypothetical protein